MSSRRVELTEQQTLRVHLFCVCRMGVAVSRHLQRVERVLLGYLEVRDPPEEKIRLKILEVLQKMTRAAWPRCPNTHTFVFLSFSFDTEQSPVA